MRGRPAAIGAVGEGDDSCGDGGTCVTRRATGGVVQVQRVAGGAAVDYGFGGGTDAAFRAVVRPNVTTPVARMRSKMAESCAYWVFANSREPLWEGRPLAKQPRSFNRNGTPRNGPIGRPCAMLRRAVASCASTTAFSTGFSRSVAARAGPEVRWARRLCWRPMRPKRRRPDCPAGILAIRVTPMMRRDLYRRPIRLRRGDVAFSLPDG